MNDPIEMWGVEDLREMVQEQRNAIKALYDDKRDQFAMAALTGLLAQGYDKFNPNEWAAQAYAYADAMMGVRTRK